MASRSKSRLLFNSTLRSLGAVSPSVLNLRPRISLNSPIAYRFAHAIPRPPTSRPSTSASTVRKHYPPKRIDPHYELTFTCVPCGDRSTHEISKQGYHHGSVLITCPSCRNRHVISDHLKIFGDRKMTIEDLMKERGQLVKRGTLGETGDVEFWEDETVSNRKRKRNIAAARNSVEEDSAENEQDDDLDEASLSREARDSSSQSTDPTPTTSALLGNTGAGPSVDSTQHANEVPSTRRQ
ncbi:DNL zinc finger-domain-containing protein [Daldinia decipiens]|uniref:DNL zinc finger-domain-containing protein n=1 Tax=Daldinia decipiens TaxID=326647 RepID=UPI0020C332B3|nr:DNL zinc finger-domain-containing protein [Daldinia decipiens]KAI1659689.1 DNL zinc finger-domain-containing protein [Daldinia decipiens]